MGASPWGGARADSPSTKAQSGRWRLEGEALGSAVKLSRPGQRGETPDADRPNRKSRFDEEPEVVEGTIEKPRTVIVEFPSMTAFRAWYDSPEYQEILAL